MAPRVLTLSHLYPSAAAPGRGTFVRREVLALSSRHPMAVISPVRWLPAAPSRRVRLERAVPSQRVDEGVEVFHPRCLAVPRGGLELESRLWPMQLDSLVRGLVREKGSEVLHAHFALPDGYAGAVLAAKTGLPFMLTVRGSDLLRLPRSNRLAGLAATALKEAAFVVAVSSELRHRAIEMGADPGRTVVLRGGVPLRRRLPVADARAAVGAPLGRTVVLWVGSLVPVKRPLLAVDAFSRLVTRRPDAVLVMLGDGPLYGDVERVVRARGLQDRVRLLRYRDADSVWAWQCASDLAINSSISEGSPMAVMEALCAGAPVAAFSVGGIPEIVQAVDGGFLAAEGSAEGLADAALRLANDDAQRDRLSRASFKAFGLVPFAREIGKLYESAARG